MKTTSKPVEVVKEEPDFSVLQSPEFEAEMRQDKEQAKRAYADMLEQTRWIHCGHQR